MNALVFVALGQKKGYFTRLCAKSVVPTDCGLCGHLRCGHLKGFFQVHMSTLNPTRKVSRRHELRQDTVVTFYARALGFFENNKNLTYGILGGIVLVVLLILGWNWNQGNRNESALSEMAEAVRLYEAGSYQASLDGDISFTGLLDISDRFGGTVSGNLATFYAADALFRVGEMDRSLEYFESYSKSADYIGASAFAGEAAIHELSGDYDEAGDLFSRAANVFESDITSPMYLERAARAYAAAGSNSRAMDVFETIQEDYPDSQAAQNVEFQLARLGSTQ